MAARDYGMTGGIVARANEMQRIAQEQLDKAKAQAEREKERLEAMKGPSPAEAAAERDRKHREAQEARQEAEAFDVRVKMKRRFQVSDPGATDEEFEKALPGLLKAHRERVALGGDTQIDVRGTFADPKMWGL